MATFLRMNAPSAIVLKHQSTVHGHMHDHVRLTPQLPQPPPRANFPGAESSRAEPALRALMLPAPAPMAQHASLPGPYVRSLMMSFDALPKTFGPAVCSESLLLWLVTH